MGPVGQIPKRALHEKLERLTQLVLDAKQRFEHALAQRRTGEQPPALEATFAQQEEHLAALRLELAEVLKSLSATDRPPGPQSSRP